MAPPEVAPERKGRGRRGTVGSLLSPRVRIHAKQDRILHEFVFSKHKPIQQIQIGNDAHEQQHHVNADKPQIQIQFVVNHTSDGLYRTFDLFLDSTVVQHTANSFHTWLVLCYVDMFFDAICTYVLNHS